MVKARAVLNRGAHFASALASLVISGTALTTAGLADKPLKIGIITFSAADLQTNAMVDAMAAEAKSKGWSTINLDAKGQPLEANSQIRQLITRGVDAIIVTVFDSNALASGMAAAADAGVPILSAGGGLVPGVAMNANTGAPKPMTDLLIQDTKGSGTFLDLTYHTGIPCRERASMFDIVVKQHPSVKATSHEINIQSAAESSQAATSAWLGANAAATGPYAIFNCFDDNAMGAIAALKQNDRKDVMVYSFNATAPALQAVRDGWMRATLWIDLNSAGKLLVDAIPEIRKQGAGWTPKSVTPNNIVVTKDNVETFQKEHPGGG
jgi:ribose transport system substrate-binding protein